MLEEQIAPELVQRAFALVHELADGGIRTCDYGATRHRAQQIVAELPKPVDPDLIEAKRLAAKTARGVGATDAARQIEADLEAPGGSSGSYGRTNQAFVDLALAAIKRGRELALTGPRP